MAQKQHVIPHNIMDVDFKLFGVMNLKQFVYVAIGGVLTYITFIMVRDGAVPAIIGWPAMVIFVVFGLSFGLLPVRGRALDQWVLSYIAAVRSPTKRAWMKKGITPSAVPSTIPIEQLKPLQVRLGTESTVSQIIGGLHIPTPEVDEKQISLIKNVDETQAVSMEGRQTLLSQMSPPAEANAQPIVSAVENIPPEQVGPSIMQSADDYQQSRYETMVHPSADIQASQPMPPSGQPITDQIQPVQFQPKNIPQNQQQIGDSAQPSNSTEAQLV